MTRDGGAVKVLVVDDDPFVRDLIASILLDGGYEVLTAGDGAEAAAMFGATSGIGLLISDMNMPGLDGLGLIKVIRGAGADVPIIILTGNSEVTTAIAALKSGADDYLIKDENIQDTIGIAVEKVLEQHFLKEQNRRLMADLAVKNERLESEKAFAQKVQENLLPRELRFPGFEVATFYRPSDMIGGDFFDAWESGGLIHFLIGDVSGHSTSSALIMAASNGILHSLGHALRDPREIVGTANRMICSIVGDSGMFLTLLYGVFDRGREELEIVSAGHNPVFLVAGNRVGRIGSTGTVIGWDADDAWESRTAAFPPGSSLVLYTDGLTEVRDRGGAEYGEEALESLLIGAAAPAAVIGSVVRAAETFCEGVFHDDLTLFILKRKPRDAGATLSLRLPTTFESVDAVRAAVLEFCRERYRQPGSETLLGDLLLAITEAMNNAVEHARAAEMEIEVVAGDRTLLFRMLTAGEPFDPTVGASFPDLDAPEGLPEGGFGRALIEALTDRVTYEYLEGKNVLTIEKQLTGGGQHGD